MREINKLLIKNSVTIKEAMKAIDIAGIKMAIVIDTSDKLYGTVTDGDIRRGILNGIEIEETVEKVTNKEPAHLREGENEEKIIETIRNKSIIGLPLIDKDNKIKDFVFLDNNGKPEYIRKSKIPKGRNIERILVIGGGGYVGSILTRRLLAKGYKVNVLDKFLYGKESLEEIRFNPNLSIIEGDTRHIEDITKAIKNVDAVVHLAELVGDPACALNPSKTQEINYLATKVIAEVCKYFQINRLVYASSCSVYGTSKENNLLTEDSPLNPVSLYAKMKIASENALREMQDDNFMPTILRFATIFGFSYRPRFDLVVNLLTAKAIKENKITIFGGTQWRPNVHVEDVADTIISVLEAPIEKVGAQIFNVGSEENNYTIHQIGELIKKVIPSAELVIEEKEMDKRDYKVGFGKLKRMLDIQMRHNLMDGIIEIKKAFDKNSDLDYQNKRYNNIKLLEEKEI